MTIKETILRYLYDNDSGSRISLASALADYNDKRSEINKVLGALKSDDIIDIDDKYSEVAQKEQGAYRDLKFCHLNARLTTPKGCDYVRNLYFRLADLDNDNAQSVTNTPNTKDDIAIANTGNNWAEKWWSKYIILPFLIGLLLLLLGALINTCFVNK